MLATFRDLFRIEQKEANIFVFLFCVKCLSAGSICADAIVAVMFHLIRTLMSVVIIVISPRIGNIQATLNFLGRVLLLLWQEEVIIPRDRPWVRVEGRISLVKRGFGCVFLAHPFFGSRRNKNSHIHTVIAFA